MAYTPGDIPQITPTAAGLKGRCPRCGAGPMFENLLRLRNRCTICDLDFSFADSGDGPMVFAIFIIGFIVVGAALLLELSAGPALWVHVVLWVPLIIVLTFFVLRPLKGILVAHQFHADLYDEHQA